ASVSPEFMPDGRKTAYQPEIKRSETQPKPQSPLFCAICLIVPDQSGYPIHIQSIAAILQTLESGSFRFVPVSTICFQ
ncbi:MAG: hypothetical protein ACRD2P_03050, partial [Terriglobia bacterium]